MSILFIAGLTPFLPLLGFILQKWLLKEHFVYYDLMTLAYGILTLFALPLSYGFFKVEKWAYLGFMVLAVGLVNLSLIEFTKSPMLLNYAILLFTVFVVGLMGLSFRRHVTAPYFNPQLKWWERDPRYRVNLRAEFKIENSGRNGALLDISQSGAYATIDSRLIPGDQLDLHLSLLDYDLQISAQVVWANKDTFGYGIRFLNLNSDSQKQLKSLLKYLHMSLKSHTSQFIDTGVPLHS